MVTIKAGIKTRKNKSNMKSVFSVLCALVLLSSLYHQAEGLIYLQLGVNGNLCTLDNKVKCTAVYALAGLDCLLSVLLNKDNCHTST